LGSELPRKPIAFPNRFTIPALRYRKYLKNRRLQTPGFGTVLAVL